MSRRTRLLIVSPSLSQGGAERFTSSLVCSLDRERFEPHVCLLRDDVTYPIPDDVPITVLHKHRPWHIPRTVTRLRRTMENWQPDVVLGTLTFINCLIGAARREYEKPVRCVARFGVAPGQEHGFLQQTLTWSMARSWLNRCEHWVANSVHLAKLIKDYYRVSHRRVDTIYSLTDIGTLPGRESQHSSPSANTQLEIVAAGRLVRQKRFDLLIDALALVRKQMPAGLTICGDGPLRLALATQISRLKLAEAVHLRPFQDDLHGMFHQADLFALSSDFEGMPNTLIEAQMMGLPAVATDCETGPNEIIVDGETGFLTPVGDAVQLAERLLRLLGDATLRKRMSEHAALRSREIFDPARTLEKWENLLSGQTEQVACAIT